MTHQGGVDRVDDADEGEGEGVGLILSCLKNSSVK